jgi:hypothetical protein
MLILSLAALGSHVADCVERPHASPAQGTATIDLPEDEPVRRQLLMPLRLPPIPGYTNVRLAEPGDEAVAVVITG